MTRKLNIDKGYNDTVVRRPAGNSGFAKKRVQWLIEHSTSHQILCYVDRFELRNPLLRKAAKVTGNLKPKIRIKKECLNQRKKQKFLENGK